MSSNDVLLRSHNMIHYNYVSNYNYEDTVTFVNAYLDKDYYTNDINLTDEEANNIDVIVNKYYKLNESLTNKDAKLL